MEKKRSIGVTVFGVVLILFSVACVFSVVSSFYRKSTTEERVILALFALIFLICGIGLLKLKAWAKNLFLFVTLIFLIGGCLQVGLLKGMAEAPSSSLLWLSFSISTLPFVISIFFFTRPKILRQFK